MAKTYYEILGVTEKATAAEIEAAFKSKAREVHPDAVSAENTYLQKVAAEAFKDLSEAKAVLLNPSAREKYDSGLGYKRSSPLNRGASEASGSVGTGSTGTSSSSQSSAQSRSSNQSGSSARSRSGSRSRTNASTAQTASSGMRRGPRSLVPFPSIKNLNSFLFMILGMATIFFLVVLVSSGRVPPIWLAAVTAALGILSFMNGMRPNAGTIVRGRAALILSATLITLVSFSLWLLSPSYFEIATSARHADAAAAGTYKPKKAPRPAASHIAAEGPTVAVVDESGPDAALPTKIWTNLKDGQNYRTRLNGDTLSLEAIASDAKAVAEIAKCEFHRAAGGAPSWVGICLEPPLPGETERKSMATLSQFSDERLEGGTGDIPVFVMTPVDSIPMRAAPLPAVPQIAPQVGPPAEGEIIGEPDLSGLRDADRESIESACTSDKLLQGPEKYNECVRKQLNELKNSPRPRGLAKLNSADRDAVEFACTTAKLMQGPAAYNQCLSKQMNLMKKQKR